MGRSARYLGVALFAALVVGIFWMSYRGTEMGSRSALFGGRELEAVTGAVAFAVSDPAGGAATLQVVDAAGGAARVLASDVGRQSPPAWSPDRTRVAYATESGRVLRTVAGGGEPAVLTDASDDATFDHAPAWSQDGTQVAFLSDGRDGIAISSVFVVPAAGGPPRHIGPDLREHQLCLPAVSDTTRCLTTPTGDADQLAWLSADELVYFSTVHQDDDPAAPNSYASVHGLYRVRLDGSPPQLIAELEGSVDQLVASPDGRFLLYGQVHGTTFVRELASGRSWEIGRHLADPSWSPDSRRVLFVDGSVYSVAADGGDRVNLTHSRIPDSFADITPSSAAWSPDGRHIAFSAYSSGGERVYVANADGTGWTEIFATDGDIAGLHWLPWQP